jgi:hypothetical protein
VFEHAPISFRQWMIGIVEFHIPTMVDVSISRRSISIKGSRPAFPHVAAFTQPETKSLNEFVAPGCRALWCSRQPLSARSVLMSDSALLRTVLAIVAAPYGIGELTFTDRTCTRASPHAAESRFAALHRCHSILRNCFSR